MITFKQPAPTVKIPEIKPLSDCGYTLSNEDLLKYQTITNQSGLATKTESVGSSITEDRKYPSSVPVQKPVRNGITLDSEAINTNSITYKYGYSDVGSLEDPNYKRLIQKGVRDEFIGNTFGFRKGGADTVSGYQYEQIQNKFAK